MEYETDIYGVSVFSLVHKFGFKMPRNLTGGSGHKGRANGEGNITMKNRLLIDSYISDIKADGQCEGVHVARILRKLGDGRMEVFYVKNKIGTNVIAPIKGSLRGRGKSQAHIDIGSIVLISETGLGGSHAFEIMAVVPETHLDKLQKDCDLDSRIFAKDVTDAEELKKGLSKDAGFEFDYSNEMNDEEIDNI